MWSLVQDVFPMACGLPHARVLARDLARRRAYRGRVRASLDHDVYVEDTSWYSAKAVLEPGRVAVDLRAKLWGLPLLLFRDKFRAGLKEALDDSLGTAYIDYPGKVFCVGFQRTGTTSLAVALRRMGIFCLDYAPWLQPDVARGQFDLPAFEEYTAFSDNPFPVIFKQLDEHFPGSKFILTVRDTASWLKSARHLIRVIPRSPIEKWIYGVEGFDAEVFGKRYESHNAAVREHFRHRGADLLVLDFKRGDGWKELGTFLDLPAPGTPFPRLNKR